MGQEHVEGLGTGHRHRQSSTGAVPLPPLASTRRGIWPSCQVACTPTAGSADSGRGTVAEAHGAGVRHCTHRTVLDESMANASRRPESVGEMRAAMFVPGAKPNPWVMAPPWACQLGSPGVHHVVVNSCAVLKKNASRTSVLRETAAIAEPWRAGFEGLRTCGSLHGRFSPTDSRLMVQRRVQSPHERLSSTNCQAVCKGPRKNAAGASGPKSVRHRAAPVSGCDGSGMRAVVFLSTRNTS